MWLPLVSGTAPGFTDGLGPDARCNPPDGILVDPNYCAIIVSDTENNAIRLIVPCDGGYFVQNATCQVCPAGTFSFYAAIRYKFMHPMRRWEFLYCRKFDMP